MVLHLPNCIFRVAVVVEDITVRSTAGKVVMVLAAIILIVCVLIMIYFYMNRSEKVIKQASPVFCQLILFGVAVADIGLLFYSLDQTPFICLVKVWLTVIGFALIMANLLAKTYRIFRIFTHIRVTVSRIKDIDLLKFTAIILLINVVLLLVYSLAGGEVTPVVMRASDDIRYSYVSCVSSDPSLDSVMLVVILLFNISLLLVTAAFAYLSRNVDSAYNESKYIALTVSGFIFIRTRSDG